MFEFPFFQELTPGDALADLADAGGLRATDHLEYSGGSGDVTGPLVPTNDIVIPPTPDPQLHVRV